MYKRGGKSRNKKRLQASKEKLEVATDAAKDHNFYEQSQIKQKMAEILREKNELLEEKRKLDKQYEDNKFEVNILQSKLIQVKLEDAEKIEFLKDKMQTAKRRKDESRNKMEEALWEMIKAKAEFNKARAILYIQVDFKEYIEHLGIIRSVEGNLPNIMNRILAIKVPLMQFFTLVQPNITEPTQWLP